MWLTRFLLLPPPVTIPEGALPGQTIAIMASGGTRRVKATVPAGLKPGDTFLVRLATPIHTEPAAAVSTLPAQPAPIYHQPIQGPRAPAAHPNFGQSLDEWLTPTPETKKPDWTSAPNMMVETMMDHLHLQHRDPPSYAPQGFISGREAPAGVPDYYAAAPPAKEIEVREQPHSFVVEDQPLRQKLLLVQVPFGMSPGTLLQVEIPGESRTVTAQIPPGVDSFYVAYTPQPPKALMTPRSKPVVQAQYQQPPPPVVVQPKSLPVAVQQQQQQQQQQQTQSPPSPSLAEYERKKKHDDIEDHHHDDQPQQPPSKPKRKLLLVRVPPNTAQGSTLHVSIPDEPGRILAAVVPPGHLTEFHVSYEPRKKAVARKPPPQQQQQQSPVAGQSYEHRHDIQQIQYYGGDSNVAPVVGRTANEHAQEHYDTAY
jgi:hypothetical protein